MMEDNRLPDEVEIEKFSEKYDGKYDGKNIIDTISTDGFDDYFEGKRTNPYLDDSIEWHSWNAGYKMAEIFA